MEPGIKKLLVAVIDQAMHDLDTSYHQMIESRENSPTHNESVRRFNEVDRWFNDGENASFGFVNICYGLGLEPDYIREGIYAKVFSNNYEKIIKNK